jgi:hypothetical protein
MKLAFGLGCPKGQTLLVPEDVTEVRISSLIIKLLIYYSTTPLALKIDAP